MGNFAPCSKLMYFYPNSHKFLLAVLVYLGLVYPNVVHAETMKNAVKTAVKTHPSGLAQRANQRAVAHELEESRSKFRPQIELFGDVGGEIVYNPNSLSAADSGRWNASREIGISARYTLFDGYERANAVYRNAARLDGALYSVLATAETLALNGVEAYIDVYRHRQLLHIARQNIRRHKKILRQIKERVAGGKSPASDSYQIEERVLAARAVQEEIRKAAKDADAKYRKVVGHSPGGKMQILRVRDLPRSKTTLINNSIAGNYEIKALTKVAAENEYSRDSSLSALSPKIFVEGRVSAGSDRSGSRGHQSDAYLGLKLTWKLYDGGGGDSQSAAFSERAGEALYQRDVRIRNIRETAEQSWNAWVSGRQRYVLLSNQAKANRKIVRHYREEYELSKRSLLDVLDAERARFNAEFQQYSVEAAYRFSTFRMLATQSRLAKFFGMSPRSIAQSPNFEKQFLESSGRGLATPSGQSIFNINIEPLK